MNDIILPIGYSNMFSIFANFPDLFVTISTKQHGSMKLFDGKNEKTYENRKKFLQSQNISMDSLVSAKLEHGNNVRFVSNLDGGEYILKTDGLVTGEKNLFLSITVADCLPVFIFDPKKEIIGLVHGGWRGLDRNIIFESIKVFKEKRSDPKDLLVGIGPGIGVCHFEVGNDVWKKFNNYPQAQEERFGKKFIDLKKIAQIQLISEGIKEENIEISPDCTYCEKEKYFSARRDKTNPLETMIAVIGMTT